MPYLINPAGRMVAVDDHDRYRELASTPGFIVPSPDQEKKFIEQKIQRIEEMKKGDDKRSDGIYLATVRTKGKDGYGVAAEHLTAELEAAGVHVALDNNGQKIGILFHNPYSILAIDTPFRFLYTMFESTKIPDDWRDYLEAADLILVPSKWCQSIFKKAGFDTVVVPLGYDSHTFAFHNRPDKRETREDYTFLHYNAFNLRKGFPEVFKAFVKAFPPQDHEPVKLVLKTNMNAIPLPITKSEYPNIEIINQPMTPKEISLLLGRSDCFVFPSRGEGFGIPPLEAMATGLPVIVPNAHGISEYFNEEFMYEVKVKGECPAIYSRYKNQDVGKMVICDADDLAYKMRWIYEHQDVAAQKGALASEYVKRYTFIESARKLREIIEDYMKKNPDEKPIRNLLQLKKIT